MKKILVILLFSTFFVSLFSLTEEAGAFENFLYGHDANLGYDNWISHIVEGIARPGYNVYASYDRQTNGFGTFHQATTDELNNWSAVLLAYTVQNWQEVEDLIEIYGFPYELVLFHDLPTGRDYYILRENINLDFVDNNGTTDTADDEIGSFNYGWGLYVFNPQSNRPIIITTPHATDDFPTPSVSYEAFVEWNARYFLITGAGREVLWTNVAPYTNTKSLSDPTRTEAHPFQKAYVKMCDEIRTTFGQREFSAQIHSSDWSSHLGYNPLQISAGNQNYSPNTPIRDFSSLHRDMFNLTPYEVFPANTIGIHQRITVDNYYAVFNQNEPARYYLPDTSIVLSNAIDLPAYSDNKQMNYTQSGWTDWDSYDPFYHIEFDELPMQYNHTTTNYNWFYGYDMSLGRFDYDRLFVHTLAFNRPWIVALGQSLNYALAMNDELIPTAPFNLSLFDASYSRATLSWERSDSYDFATYEVLYSTEPVENENFQIWSRTNDTQLAQVNNTQTTITGLTPSTTYYFKVRGKDKNGNYSELSNEITAVTGVANLTNFKALGWDGRVKVSFRAQTQQNNQGFVVYRANNSDGPYMPIADYHTAPELVGSTANNVDYTYTDFDVANGNTYYYKIAGVQTDDTEFLNNTIVEGSPQVVKGLQVALVEGALADTCYFGMNPYAYDGYDANFDTGFSGSTTGDYLQIQIYDQYGYYDYQKYFEQQIYGQYDPNNEVKSWVIRVRSNQTGQNLRLSLIDNFTERNRERIYLVANGNYVNLAENDFEFTVANANWVQYTLYWGNFQPTVTVSNNDNRIFQPGDNRTVSWSVQNSGLVSGYGVFLKNATDSLMVTNTLAANTTSYSLNFTEAMLGENYNVEVHAYLPDGDSLVSVSPYKIGVLPVNYSFTYEPGWHMITNPVQNPAIDPAVSFPENTSLYYYLSGFYFPVNSFEYTYPYWLKNMQTVDYTVQNATLKEDATTINLVAGWNFIANPHACVYEISQLRFNTNNSLLDYSEALQNNIIKPGIFTYDGCYKEISTIDPGISFWLYSNYDGVSLNFTPYYQNPLTPSLAYNWKISILGEVEGMDSDEIILASSVFADSLYDVYYDLFKAPQKALDTKLDLSLNPLFEGMETQKFHQLTTHPFGLQATTQLLTFPAALQLDFVTPVTFRFSSLDFPQSYCVYLDFPEESINLTELQNYVYTPHTNTTLFTVRVYNQQVGSNNAVAFVSKFTNYPNPFNPTTSIAFSLRERTKVELDVYNIKGQKVVSLVNDNLEKGQHVIKWNGKNNAGKTTASGVYFARLKTSSKTQVRKMLLLK